MNNIQMKITGVWTRLFNQDSVEGSMASKYTIWKGRARLCRTKLGSIFLILLSVACVLCVINWFSSTYSRTGEQVEEFDAVGRHLSGLPGEEAFHHRGHKKHKKHRNHDATNGEEAESQQVCEVPKLTLETDANREAFFTMEPLKCVGQHLFYLDNTRLKMNRTVLGGAKLVHCDYRAIGRVDDRFHTYSSPLRRKDNFEIVVKNDFFQVECFTEETLKKVAQFQQGGEYADYQNHRRLQGIEDEVKAPVWNANEIEKGAQQQNNELPNAVYPDGGSEQKPNQDTSQDNIKAALSNRNAQNQIPNQNIEKEEAAIDNVALDEVHFNPHDDYENYGMDYDMSPSSPDFDQVFAQVFPTDEIKQRLSRIKPFPNSTQMNVLIFGLDSMSHLSYQRKLPLTYDYLKNKLGSVVLDGYNVVGDATTAALIPIFTGHAETELPETRTNVQGSHYVDIYPFVWNKYEQSGYVTMYIEDQPSLGAFQLRLNGFEEAPVDHYMRPFWQAALNTEIHNDSPQYCLGGKTEHQYTLDYVKDLFVKYPEAPKFAFALLGELSHADNNPAEYIDGDLVKMLEYLQSHGDLDNTLLVVMGDHGARYSKVRQTTQGKLEERLPFMSLAFPKKFQDKYPHLMKNLNINKKRLTTPFDLHETLQTVLNTHLAETPVTYKDRGISLLKEIPANRTCDRAGVALHWCTCLQYEYLDTTDPKMKRVADYVVREINKKLTVADGRPCNQLTLSKIHEARMVFPNEQVLKFIKSKDDDNRVANFSQSIKLDILHYQITIETEPNHGMYEVTLQAVVRDGTFSIVGDISRINKYGDQPHCILNSYPDLRKYCHCKNEPTPGPKPKSRKPGGKMSGR